jgi:pimeloyl-ACP methyl ester carboxylesterase
MKKKQVLLNWKILSYYDNSLWKKEWVFIFLHGWMQDGTSFKELFELFENENIPYVSLDLPGFWSSALIHQDMSIENYGSVVTAFIEKLELIKPTLVWHSFWWRISIYLWSFYENIDKIILIWSAWIAPKMNPIRLLIVKIGKWVFSLPGLKQLWKKVKSSVSGDDYAWAGKMTQIFKNTISNDLQDYMKKIPFKTLMIWWEDDDQVTVDEAQIMHEHIKNSDLHIFKWDHFIHKQEPQKIIDLIFKFRQT